LSETDEDSLPTQTNPQPIIENQQTQTSNAISPDPEGELKVTETPSPRTTEAGSPSQANSPLVERTHTQTSENRSSAPEVKASNAAITPAQLISPEIGGNTQDSTTADSGAPHTDSTAKSRSNPLLGEDEAGRGTDTDATVRGREATDGLTWSKGTAEAVNT